MTSDKVNNMVNINKTARAHIRHIFSAHLSYSECEDLYKQQIKYLIVTNQEGKRIQLPKENLRKFVTPTGIKGRFELIVDQNNKLVSITLLK